MFQENIIQDGSSSVQTKRDAQQMAYEVLPLIYSNGGTGKIAGNLP